VLGKTSGADYDAAWGAPLGGTLTFGKPGALAVAPGASKVYVPGASGTTLRGIRASVGTAPTGAAITVTLVKNGSTTIATATIAAGAVTSGRVTLSDALASTDYLTVGVTQVGSTVAGSDLTVQVEYA
jgi:hypothetical protein